MSVHALITRLQAAVDDGGWLSDAQTIAPYVRDWQELFEGYTPLVVRPADTAQASKVVRLCAKAGVALVPQGGNTGLVGGAIPDQSNEQIIISLERMNRIRDIDAANFTMTVEAGCILANIQEAAARNDLHFPLSLGAEGSCQIGGNLATNAGGTS